MTEPAVGGVPPRVSVIVPVYNAERDLKRCADSILAQTLRELEVVFVDDGSTDGSPAIIDAYAAAHPGRVVAIHKPNEGVSCARNTALRVARGRYIGFVDSDDYIAPDMYERLHAAITGEDFALATCRRYSLMSGRTVEKPFAAALTDVPALQLRGSDDLGRLLADISVFIWDKLFDGDIIRAQNLLFPEGHIYGEDFCFLAKYLYYAKRVAFVDAPLYYYNAFSEGSITNSISEHWYYIYDNLQEIIDFYKEKGIFGEMEPYLCRLSAAYYDRRANALFLYGKKLFQRKFVKYSLAFLSRNFPHWAERLGGYPEVLFPAVKRSLFLMTVYIFTPNCIKKLLVRRVESRM
ncbi:MAG: glycosyltransferase [Clostridiales Family XIII bacterium]|jgi:glycosyltransferase involved in cell wall biosynthesis|nr:glycosyltransferase [Clostridiales Family XIII bacterium]